MSKLFAVLANNSSLGLIWRINLIPRKLREIMLLMLLEDITRRTLIVKRNVCGSHNGALRSWMGFLYIYNNIVYSAIKYNT